MQSTAPAAAGKGTIAREISQQLGLAYLDTGLLYRATAARMGDDMSPLQAATSLTPADFSRSGLRDPAISQEASRISAIPEVRAVLDDFQKNFARRPGGAVLDGRDIGTNICPTANLKLYLTASPEARARRRHVELANKGHSDSYDEVLQEMQIRDARDAGRAVAPMKPARDAILIDTSNITAMEAIEIALAHADRAFGAATALAA